MPYDINQALERLERNLQNVDSARQQVESIIASNKSLQSAISNYSSTLGSLVAEVEKWIKDLGDYQKLNTSEMQKAITKIVSSCDTVIIDFKTKLNSELSTLSGENVKLAKSISDLNALHEDLKSAIEEINNIKKKIDEISELLKSSQESQDETLATIKSTIEGLPELIQSHLNTVSQNIESKINSAKGELASSLSSISTKCDTISSEIANLKSLFESSVEKLNSSININRWILIAGIVALVALHFIKF